MKKTYNSPATKIVKLNISRNIMLATSGPGLNSNAANQSYGMDARESSSWDIWGSNDDYDD